jgi:hypothetical protein
VIRKGASANDFETLSRVRLADIASLAPRLDIQCTAPLKELYIYYGGVGTDFGAAIDQVKPTGNAERKPVPLDANGCPLPFTLPINELLAAPYFRLEGTTTTGVKVYTNPIFLDPTEKNIKPEIPELFIPPKGGGIGYSEACVLWNTSATSSLHDIAYHTTDFSDSAGNIIPASLISIVASTQDIGPLACARFTVCIALPAGFPEGTYEGSITIVAMSDEGHAVTSSTQTRILVDSTGPQTPVIQALDSPIDTLPSTVLGFGEPGSIVDILVDGTTASRGVVDALGRFVIEISVSKGEHDITARSKDASSNISAETAPIHIECLIDGIAPVCSAELIGDPLPTSNWYASDVTVELCANEEAGGSGLAQFCYLVSGDDAWHDYTGPITVSSEGQCFIAYWAVDNEGNLSDLGFLTIGIDRDQPVAEISQPLSGATLQGMIEILGVGRDSRYCYRELTYAPSSDTADEDAWRTIGNMEVDEASGAFRALWDTRGNARRAYTIRLQVTDESGRQSTDFIEIVTGDLPGIDGVSPAVASASAEITITGTGFGLAQGHSMHRLPFLERQRDPCTGSGRRLRPDSRNGDYRGWRLKPRACYDHETDHTNYHRGFSSPVLGCCHRENPSPR